MCSRLLIFLIGAVFVDCQVVEADVYFGQLMMEGDVTMDTQAIASVLNVTSPQVNKTCNLTVFRYDPVAECLINGSTTNCNCSTGNTWSNDVCYNYSCCSETTCYADVSNMTSVCIPKVTVQINGSVTLNSGNWDATKTIQLQNFLQALNGFQYLNITDQRLNNKIADFKAAVSVKFPTFKLQGIVTQLENNLTAAVLVNTSGMVTILAPKTQVKYQSSPVLSCAFEEATDSATWNILKGMYERTELTTNNVVKLNNNCTTPDYKSYIGLTLQQVTGDWPGTYECGFTKGSIKHTATAELSVALLPDVITMVSSPLTANCSDNNPIDININATIPQSSENYKVQWTYNNNSQQRTQIFTYQNQSNQSYLVYNVIIGIRCEIIFNTPENVTVTFTNSKGQTKLMQLGITVKYGSQYCLAEAGWPNTSVGITVINRTCTVGRVGFQSRTCDTNGAWQAVFDYCVSEQIDKISKDAENWNGSAATQQMAMSIFEQLNNCTFASSITIADIIASISILNVMFRASKTNVLSENVLPNFINAASNMLNNKWDEQVNTSFLFNMSSTYLESVEGLVKNIHIDQSNGVNSTNLDLKFCSNRKCNVSVFDTSVNINTNNGILKFVAVKKLMNILENSYSNMKPHSLLLSATLQSNEDVSLAITLDFPNEQADITRRTKRLIFNKPLCVFWNTTERKWSTEGCIVSARNGNYIQCKCSHLTAFTVLMSKGEKPVFQESLDIITNVGLGVSIGSLLIFLFIESLVWSALVKTKIAHFRHTCLVNIATFLLLADCCFLASSSPGILTDSWCLVFTICKHLFFLAMFCWMLCLSIMLVHQLVFVFSPLGKRGFIFLSSVVGYVFPIVIVGFSYAYYKHTNIPYYNEDCWLVFEGLLVGSMHAFLLPVGTIALTNLFCMMIVIFTLVTSPAPDSTDADKKTAICILKVVVFLTPVFGVTWIFGFIYLILEPDSLLHIAASFCFTLLNSFQGFLIVVVACLNEQKVREELFKILTSKLKQDSMKNLTLTTMTKGK